MRQVILGATSFRLQDCVCRVEQDKVGTRRCSFPLETWLLLSTNEAEADELTISREEALAVLDRAEQAGLVHTVSNVVEGVGYICNCCGCCCELLRGINEWGIEHSVAQAGYHAVIDLRACTDCGVCLARSQVDAMAKGDGGPIVDHYLCIGCGLCATGCQEKAAQLVRRPEAEIRPPPLDRRSWEEQRLRKRADPSSPSSKDRPASRRGALRWLAGQPRRGLPHPFAALSRHESVDPGVTRMTGPLRALLRVPRRPAAHERPAVARTTTSHRWSRPSADSGVRVHGRRQSP